MLAVMAVSGCTAGSGPAAGHESLEIGWVSGVFDGNTTSIVVIYNISHDYNDRVMCHFYMDGVIAENLYEEVDSGVHVMAVQADADMEETIDVGVCCDGTCRSEELGPDSWISQTSGIGSMPSCSMCLHGQGA